MSTLKKLLTGGCLAAAALSGATMAADSTTMNVSASVIASCDITASPLAFGNIDVRLGGIEFDEAADLSVTCTDGTDYTVSLSRGENDDSSTRRMTNGANFLPYELYSDETRATEWLDAGETNTGDGTAQIIKVYGRIPADQAVPVGTYTDVIAVTMTY